MDTAESLSPSTRGLTAVTAAVLAVVGAVFFVAPKWSADQFPWKVTDFQAMTIGGWCLGNAYGGWLAVARWRWASSHLVLLYLWSFCVLEMAVLVWFFDLIRWDGVLTYPYLLALLLGVVATAKGFLDWLRLRPPASAPGDPPLPTILRVMAGVFVVLVGVLAAIGLFRPKSGRTMSVFPEVLSAFTLRAFAVFYLSLAIGALPVLWERAAPAALTYIQFGLVLIVPITVAAFVYIGRFDFSDRPRQMLYIGAYLLVFVLAAAVLLRGPRAPSRQSSGEMAGGS